MRRVALPLFGGSFLVLFILIAAIGGIGNPDIPSEAVAVIEDAPEGLGTITKDQFHHALVIVAATNQVKPVPKPGDEKYEDLEKTALGELLDTVWIQGLAEEMGISASAKEISERKKQAFAMGAQYQELLKEGHYTREDLNQRVKVEILSSKIQEKLKEEAHVPSSSEIKDYYEAAKSSWYTTPESRDIRIVINEDKAKVEEAQARLERDDSVGSWERIAQQFSTDSLTNGNGGLQADVHEAQLPEPLNAAVFAAPQGKLEGPLKESRVYGVFEVMKISPEKTSSLEEVESQISSQLSERDEQQSFAGFLRNYESNWRSRTFCASEIATERCANFKGDGRPSEANPACYEANPAEPPEACPAPVAQLKPALPGSISPLAPEGERQAQRPRPAGLEPPQT